MLFRSLKSVADVDSKSGIFGVEDIPLRASLEGVGVGFNEVFKLVDPSIELAYFGCMVVLSLFNCFEQRLGNALQGVGVEISAAVEDVSGRAGRDGVIGEGVSRGDQNRRRGTRGGDIGGRLGLRGGRHRVNLGHRWGCDTGRGCPS